MADPRTPRPASAWPAWPLALRLGRIEACNPFVDGCVSISRAARHGLPIHIFRALLLPAAALPVARLGGGAVPRPVRNLPRHRG